MRRSAVEVDLEQQVEAARTGDVTALDFVRRHGPHGRVMERIRELQREIDEARERIKHLPSECVEHLDDRGGGGEAWIDTCVLCGRTEVS